jgi:hypothetical protein
MTKQENAKLSEKNKNRETMIKHKRFGVVLRTFSRGLAIITLFSFFPFFVEGAVLYLEPSQGEYHQNDTFIVEARIDTGGKCINTVKAIISFPKDLLEAKDFSTGNSILSLWLESPKIDQKEGLISFVGGIPGGFCGPLPGEPEKPNLLGRIIFRVVSRDVSRSLAQIAFRNDSQVLLNDGFGTQAKLTLKEAVFTILTEKLEVPKDEWQEELSKDDIPPEPFEIKISQDPNIFGGKYFIVFSTTDKQTGIDHYEVKETRKRHETERETTRNWKRAESPYLLEDQSLKSIIKVKAVDKAGNERIAEYVPPQRPLPYWVISPVAIGMGIIIWLIAKLRRKKARK